MPSDSVARLQAAVVDGRAHNVFYRQTQLERLCKALLTKEAALRNAMIKDSAYSPAEAIAVLHAAVQAVKDSYATLQPQKALDDEYRIAHGNDAPDASTPLGLVYIEPRAHTLLYSVCGPLSSAIAAGNCVVLLLENNLRELPTLIRGILTSALDADTFALVSSPADVAEAHPALTLSTTSRRIESGPSQTNRSASSPVVAVVDRTADMHNVAGEIITAATSFGGQSPYAPKVVLVNEFVFHQFLEAAQTELKTKATGERSNSSTDADGSARLIELDTLNGTVSTPKSKMTIRQAMTSKLDQSILLVQPTRSLDDAINLLDEANTAPYPAAYHFSDYKSAKYLSQFVDAEVTFVNHIPRRLLLGSALPAGSAFDLESRYPASLFTLPRPAYAKPSGGDEKLAAVLQSGDGSAAQELLKQAKEPLRVMKRSEGGGVGFFEQGFLMNASFILVGALTLSATGLWQLWKYRGSR